MVRHPLWSCYWTLLGPHFKQNTHTLVYHPLSVFCLGRNLIVITFPVEKSNNTNQPLPQTWIFKAFSSPHLGFPVFILPWLKDNIPYTLITPSGAVERIDAALSLLSGVVDNCPCRLTVAGYDGKITMESFSKCSPGHPSRMENEQRLSGSNQMVSIKQIPFLFFSVVFFQAVRSQFDVRLDWTLFKVTVGIVLCFPSMHVKLSGWQEPLR